MIVVIATIEVTDGSREAFLAEFRQIIAEVRAEQGCIEYGPFVDLQTSIPAQGDARANVVTVVEKWADVEALERHLAAPHMVSYRGRVKRLIQSVSLQVLESAE